MLAPANLPKALSPKIPSIWSTAPHLKCGIALSHGCLSGDYILDKARYSSFYSTNIEFILRRLTVDTLIICGVTTEICLESTIRDYKIVFPEDAVAPMDVACQYRTIQTIPYGFGTVTTTVEVIDYLGVPTGVESHHN